MSRLQAAPERQHGTTTRDSRARTGRLAHANRASRGRDLFYPTYSTIVGRAGIHLEDLYVRPEYRGSGLGQALLAHLADLAVRRGCARLEWWVLRTNEPALRFYRRLHARGLDEIEVLRLDGEPLRRLAASHGDRAVDRVGGSRSGSRGE